MSPQRSANRTRLLIASGVLALLIIVGIIFVLVVVLNGGDKTKNQEGVWGPSSGSLQPKASATRL